MLAIAGVAAPARLSAIAANGAATAVIEQRRRLAGTAWCLMLNNMLWSSGEPTQSAA